MRFDPEHLRVAAKVRAKGQRRRWFELAGWMLFLLIMSLGAVWVVVVLAHTLLLAIRA